MTFYNSPLINIKDKYIKVSSLTQIIELFY